MKLKFLLVFSIFCFFSSFISLGQTAGKHSFKSFFSPDSLRGFDEQLASQTALKEGLYGDEYKVYLNNEKKQFIINKYYPNSNGTDNFKISNLNSVFAAPCVNEGFELGNFTGWTATLGSNTNSCAYPTATTVVAALAPTLSVLGTPLVDPVTGVVIPNSPLGGSFVAKINNNAPSGKVIKLTQNFAVTTSNYVYDFAYYAVQNGVHNCCQQPYMFVRLRDCVGNLLACPVFSFNAPSGLCASTGPVAWVNTGLGGANPIWRSNGWQKYSMDLTQYIGTCITVEVMVADCSPTGHYLYTYFDSNCNTMNLTINATSTLSMPSQTVTPIVACGSNATLTAPSGLNPYLWNGPGGSGVTSNTNQSVSTSVAGNYTLVMTPVGVCTPITRIINLSFAPPTTVVATPSVICTTGSNTVSILSASGAASYTWSTGATTPTIAVSPTTTTVYSVTAVTGTCSGVFTVQVNVSSTPTINITPISPSVCLGQPATLTANGATSYTWSTGSTVNPTTVTPIVSTTYSVVGTTTAGCSGTASLFVFVISTPTVSAFNLSGTICSGSSANCVATGALTYTWYPGAIVGNIVALSPTVTTTYTIIGAASSCTNTATLTVPVSNGPTLTVTGTPTAICPGNSATLSASGATGYTWNPGGTVASSIVVSPSATTNYSVTGVNVFGCTSTHTINQIVSPVPNITITPASTSICIGSVASLTASGASSYTWNPGNLTTAVVAVSPTISTTFIIVGSNGTCTNSATALLTVVPIPTVTASSSTTQICNGNSITLTGSGATSYTWNPGGLTGASVVTSPTVTTTYTVVGSTASCTNNAIVTVTVNNGPLITANATPNLICAGNSSTLSATGALSYTWNPGSLSGGTITVTPASTTIYSVTGDNVFGCLTTQTVNLTVNPNPTVVASASSPSICTGSNATLTASGATSYTWNPGSVTGSSFVASPLVNTTYTVNGLTAGCPGQTTITITVVPIPTLGAIVTPTAICNGSTATLTASGATSYTWNPGSLTGTTVLVSPSATTNYTVTGNNVGCSSTATIGLIVNPTPTLTANATPTTICVSGNVTLTASGATTYTWLPPNLIGSTVVDFISTTTNYTLIGLSAAGCSNTAFATVTVNAIPVLTVASSPTAICAGNSATLTCLGATAYTWNPGALTGSNIVVTPATTTNYTVTGTNGFCSNTQTINVVVNPNPTITASSTPTNICVGGTATLSATGATSYTWNPGTLSGSTVTVSPSSTTLYTVTGVLASGCISTQTVNLLVTPIPTITAIANPTAICIGNTSSLSASGATTYSWNPGAIIGATVSVSPVVNTTYTVTGTTGICNSTTTVNVIVNPIPTLALVATPTAICFGGSGTLSATGGTSYTWNPGGLTGTSVVVSPTINTTYTVSGINGFGCSNTATINLIVNPNPTLTIVASPTAICSGNSSTLTGSAIGGGPFTSIWNPGAVAGTSIAVSPTVTTTYTWSVVNAFACSTTQTITLNVTPTPTVVASAANATICAGSSTTLNAVGATSYTWNPGLLIGSTVTVSPLVSTVYTVSGANGSCISTQTIIVSVNPNPTIIASATSTNICSSNSTTLSATGALNYTWNPGGTISSSVSVNPLVTTNYTVIGSSASGCTNQAVITISVTSSPTITASANSATTCFGGTSTLSASGATSYTWNPGGLTGSSTTVNPITSTIYTVTGANGSCVNSNSVSVTVNALPAIIANASPNPLCAGNQATLSASGASTYTWNPGLLTGSSVTVSPIISTTYTVQGTSALGCVGSATVNLIVNPQPTVAASSTSTNICAGSTVTLSASGGISYFWSPIGFFGPTTPVTPSITTTYTVAGTNAFGCVGVGLITISVTPIPTVNLSSSSASVCSGNSATLTATGASAYTWNPGGSTSSSVVVSPLTNTTYTVIGANGFCTSTNTITLFVNPNPTINATASPSNICAGSSSTLSAIGASSYTWNPGALSGSSVVVSPLTSTIYTVNGTNAPGCLGTQTIDIIVTPTPTVNLSSLLNPICSGNSTTLSATGATGYTWNPGSLSGSSVVVSPLTTNQYTVVGQTGICTASNVITVTVNPTPTLTAATSASVICAGSTASLGVIGANSYTWLPVGITGSLITVSPSVTTNYTVIGQTLAGCTSNTTVLITVNPLPTITVNSPTTSICSGSTLNLTASGASTYTWIPGSLIGASQTITLTGTTAYTVAGTSSLGCNSTTVFTINVTPTPTIIASASNPSICSGQSTTLTATGAGSFTWQPGSITGSLAVVSPTTNTTYTVTGQNGTCVNSQTIDIIINPTPTITITPNNTIICIGSSATLTASGANTYTWLTSLPVVSPSVVVTPTVATNYTLIGTSASGCTTQAVASLSVDLTPTLSVSGATAVCGGNSATLIANGATTYTWLPFSLTSSVAVVSPTSSTTYTLVGQNGACITSYTNNLNVGVTPTINASISSSTICAGSSLSLTATGASTYSWLPISSTGSLVTDLPTANTIYTVIGTTTVGCSGTSTIGITVTPGPIVTITPTSTFVCTGGSATLNLSGAISYTWIPGTLTGTSVVVSPTVTQTYTVTGENISGGCTNTQTIQISVFSTPTVTALSTNSALCSGQTATLTANGASTYTWEPGTITSSLAIVSPTTTTVYTVTGSNASCGTSTATVTITVNSIPNPTASVSGTISCATPSVNLIGASTPTSVSYSWSGPFSFTSSVQSPGSITISGVYTLSVVELTTGCSATSTINVQSDGSVPSITLTTTGNITCANNTVTLSATSSGTNVGYAWQGPSSYTSNTAIISTTLAGNYTLTITDLTSNCPASTVAVILSNTTVPITTTILPATCSGTATNNNGSIIAAGFVPGDKFDFVLGTTYTGTATYTSAVNISTTGVLTSTLTNPLVITPITIRYFGVNGCIKDTTVLLIPTSCATNTVFGIAKSVTTVSLLTNSTYSVNYKVIVKNNSNANLNNVILYENLNNTFPLPTTFTITSTPTIITTASGLTLEPSFNGNSQTILTNTLSVLNANSTDTLLFGLTISHNGIFGPFNNTVFGVAQTTSGIVYVDSSQVGNNPDFDNDGLFSDDNVPTPLNLPPKLFFGLTKVGAISEKLSDGTYDISYTITAHNLGNDTLKNVVIKDSLFNNTIRIPASYTLKNGPVASGSLIANTLFNGNTAINLINPSLSVLPPGATSFVSFTINVNPDTVTVFSNSAFGSAISSNSTLVNDISGDGTNPDLNNNGVWNEAIDNKPTVLTISNFTLFVPQGFSPDGDGKNEAWVIKGLPAGNKVTVFNRWGSKVFEQTEYNNTWIGFPNVSGSLGSNKLPQGTYYYIIEFNDKSIKPLNGFVVLQY